ncbi:MAG: hypothetical protein M9922_11915 [Microthrixaceae bacterium]|nr:hypothetical protein [Microthrixaceae bacterium]MCO5322090.1 hypothetical protein [Microthrixaceae bacterium]
MPSEQTETEHEVLTRYLGPPQVVDHGGTPLVQESSLHAALRDCRPLQGRDAATGLLPAGEGAPSWIGAIGYLCVVDQLSSAVRHAAAEARSRAEPEARKKYRALYDFTELDDEAIEALYGLRCSLAHDYSLANRKPGLPARQHVFHLTGDPGEVVILPSAELRWTGEWADSEDSFEPTEVRLRSVGDLVEEVVNTIRAEHRAGNVQIALPGGRAEMDRRYFFLHNDFSILGMRVSAESPPASGSPMVGVADLGRPNRASRRHSR